MLSQPGVENILRDPEKKGQPCPRGLTCAPVDHHRWRLSLDRVNISILRCGEEVRTALQGHRWAGLGCRGRLEKGSGAGLQRLGCQGERPCSQGTGCIRDTTAWCLGGGSGRGGWSRRSRSRRGLECQVQGSHFNHRPRGLGSLSHFSRCMCSGPLCLERVPG